MIMTQQCSHSKKCVFDSKNCLVSFDESMKMLVKDTNSVANVPWIVETFQSRVGQINVDFCLHNDTTQN